MEQTNMQTAQSMVQNSLDFSKMMLTDSVRHLNGESLSVSRYDPLLAELEDMDLMLLDQDDLKKAFWLNIYNGLTNHIIITHRIRDSVLMHPGFFSQRSLEVGGIRWSLNEIEHGLLRMNKHPFGSPFPVFSHHSIRKQFMVERLDPRIHFALNCGGESCPAIRFYSAEHIDDELNIAEQAFLQRELIRDEENQQIFASKIFKWYRTDFDHRYITEEDERHYKIIYRHYQWHL
ncbi:MAG: DUF547 domain-containing protein [Spirochaetia bacterium]|nr:DUF547 domain-containing protein [Spirochaetia bacterium]MCF7941794.1 DUF547 domain-containing protein [Spirochaetia bacterium]